MERWVSECVGVMSEVKIDLCVSFVQSFSCKLSKEKKMGDFRFLLVMFPSAFTFFPLSSPFFVLFTKERFIILFILFFSSMVLF